MKTLEIKLPEQTFVRLQTMAEKLGLSLDQLLQLTVEEKLEQLDQPFTEATRYVLHKNQELYKRLA